MGGLFNKPIGPTVPEPLGVEPDNTPKLPVSNIVPFRPESLLPQSAAAKPVNPGAMTVESVQGLVENGGEESARSAALRAYNLSKVDPKVAQWAGERGLDAGSLQPDVFKRAEAETAFDPDKLRILSAQNPYLYRKIIDDPHGFGQQYFRSDRAYEEMTKKIQDSYSQVGYIESLTNAIVGGGANLWISWQAAAEAMKAATGSGDRFHVEQLAAQQQALAELMPTENEGEQRGFLASAPIYAGQQVANLAAAGGAAVAGTLATGGPWGGVAGVAASSFMVEAGAAYMEFSQIEDMTGQRVPEQEAAVFALGVGALNAGLETIGAVKLLKMVPGLRKYVAGKALKESLKEAMLNPSVRREVLKQLSDLESRREAIRPRPIPVSAAQGEAVPAGSP